MAQKHHDSRMNRPLGCFEFAVQNLRRQAVLQDNFSPAQAKVRPPDRTTNFDFQQRLHGIVGVSPRWYDPLEPAHALST
jgi:hypothetical protein